MSTIFKLKKNPKNDLKIRKNMLPKLRIGMFSLAVAAPLITAPA